MKYETSKGIVELQNRLKQDFTKDQVNYLCESVLKPKKVNGRVMVDLDGWCIPVNENLNRLEKELRKSYYLPFEVNLGIKTSLQSVFQSNTTCEFIRLCIEVFDTSHLKIVKQSDSLIAIHGYDKYFPEGRCLVVLRKEELDFGEYNVTLHHDAEYRLGHALRSSERREIRRILRVVYNDFLLNARQGMALGYFHAFKN